MSVAAMSPPSQPSSLFRADPCAQLAGGAAAACGGDFGFDYLSQQPAIRGAPRPPLGCAASPPAASPKACSSPKAAASPKGGMGRRAASPAKRRTAAELAQAHACGVLFGPRMRKSPFFDRTLEHGVAGFMSYNHMLLPSHFSEGPEAEYKALCNDVCVWDVGAQRQVQLEGPDAAKLAQLMTPRWVEKMKVGQCRYVLICDQKGHVLNDPVLTKLAADKFWLSVADSDVLLWAKGLAIGRGLDVEITEPDVSPLAVQGPKSLELVTALLGEWVRELNFFECRETELDGIPLLVARSGWSPELGYELYLRDSSRGSELWDKVWAKGEPLGIKPGAPNQVRRIEGGLLSYGGDFPHHGFSALELGLPKFMLGALDRDGVEFIGKAALLKARADGTARRRVVGVELVGCGDERLPFRVVAPWPLHSAGDLDRRAGTHAAGDSDGVVGQVSVMSYSPRLRANIALAQVASLELAEPGTMLTAVLPDGRRVAARVTPTPFPGTSSPLQKQVFVEKDGAQAKPQQPQKLAP